MTHPHSFVTRTLLMAVVAVGFTATPALAKAKHGSSAKARPVPVQISPADDAQVPAGKTVVFTWHSPAKVVRIEVARDSAFTDIAVSTAVRGNNAGLKLAEGAYYWRLSVPKGPPSEARRLTVGAPPAPEPLAAAPTPAAPPPSATPGAGSSTSSTSGTTAPQAETGTTEGLGLDLSGAAPSTGSTATTPAPSTGGATAESAPAPESTAPPSVSAESEAEQAPAEAQHPRAERVESPWRVFVGGNAAIGFGSPANTATLRYEGGVAYRLLPALELSLAVGGAEVAPLGTFDPTTWPRFAWNGQIYGDLSARYRLTKLGPGPLFALASVRLSFLTAPATDRGFLQDRSPFAAGVGLGYRFRVGIPVEVDLRGNLLTGSAVAGELELGVRVFVF